MVKLYIFYFITNESIITNIETLNTLNKSRLHSIQIYVKGENLGLKLLNIESINSDKSKHNNRTDSTLHCKHWIKQET